MPLELAAARKLLDEEHESPAPDPNLYTLGCMEGHNVILACLPAGQTGTNSAAAIAEQLKAKFKSFRFGLMVGVGGGVPNDKDDIRLGDVVISQPSGTFGGVVQYDFGKVEEAGEFKRTGFLNAPPSILLQAVSKLRSNHYQGEYKISQYLAAVNRGENGTFAREQAGPDRLFKSNYNHSKGSNCDNCDANMLVRRGPRSANDPIVHYGNIASGNSVMKDGTTRDKLSADLEGVLCYEMEAAGLMNSFPCLVIRGICDYSDTHKSKGWQPFAAVTAAACAKELLSLIPRESSNEPGESWQRLQVTGKD